MHFEQRETHSRVSALTIARYIDIEIFTSLFRDIFYLFVNLVLPDFYANEPCITLYSVIKFLVYYNTVLSIM